MRKSGKEFFSALFLSLSLSLVSKGPGTASWPRTEIERTTATAATGRLRLHSLFLSHLDDVGRDDRRGHGPVRALLRGDSLADHDGLDELRVCRRPEARGRAGGALRQPPPLPDGRWRQRDAPDVDARGHVAVGEQADRLAPGEPAGVDRGLRVERVAHMEDEPAEERQVLVDGHLETSDVPPRGRHDDARAAGGACKLVGLIDVQDDARGVVNEAREVEERGDDATGAEGGHGGCGREGGAF